jgi:hypothetical protein
MPASGLDEPAAAICWLISVTMVSTDAVRASVPLVVPAVRPMLLRNPALPEIVMASPVARVRLTAPPAPDTVTPGIEPMSVATVAEVAVKASLPLVEAWLPVPKPRLVSRPLTDEPSDRSAPEARLSSRALVVPFTVAVSPAIAPLRSAAIVALVAVKASWPLVEVVGPLKPIAASVAALPPIARS